MPAAPIHEGTADMRLLITSADRSGVAVVEPDDTRQLSVETPLTDRSQVASALREAGAGRLDGDHAWLDIDFLRRTAAPADPASWVDAFDAMIKYAERHGWVSDDGRQVRAHLESTTRAEP
jgi:hypothetical protein